MTQTFMNMHEAMTARLVCENETLVAAVDPVTESEKLPPFELYLVPDLPKETE